jgi:hypothetical protein
VGRDREVLEGVVAPRPLRAPEELLRAGREGASGSRQIGQFWMNRLCRQKLGTDDPG